MKNQEKRRNVRQSADIIEFMSAYDMSDGNNEKPPKRKFWQNLLIMDSGDLKRLLSLSSLMLCFAIIFVYIISYVLLMPLIDRLIGSGPVLLVTFLESVIPAVIGTAAVMLTWPLYRDKRVLPAAYLWLVLLALILLAGVILKLRGDGAFLYYSAWDGLPPLIIGNFAAWRKYKSFISL